MSSLSRFGVSMDADLLQKFDAFCRDRGYANRSEALRDLVREALVQETAVQAEAQVAGSLTLVYDHHKSDLAQRLTSIQHQAQGLVLATLHVHLDHCNCLEVLALRGPNQAVQDLAQQILSVKGVKHGKFVLTTTGGEFA